MVRYLASWDSEYRAGRGTGACEGASSESSDGRPDGRTGGGAWEGRKRTSWREQTSGEAVQRSSRSETADRLFLGLRLSSG